MNRKKWVTGFFIVVVLVGIFYFWRGRAVKTEYLESVVKKGEITIKILSTGTVQPQNRLQLKSPVAGRVDQVLVREGDKVRKGQILAWLSSTERAALMDAARSQTDDDLKRWQEFYKATPLIAPISGTIILRSVEPGQTFTTADAVLVMSDRLTVKAQVDETDLAQIHVHQKAEITLDAYAEKVFPAVVDQIAYEAKSTNNVTTYMVDVLPKESIEFMRSGMTANVTFVGETKTDLTLIPNEFIKYEDGKPVTTVKQTNGPMPQELRLGLSDGRVTEVLEGLKESDTVMLALNKKEKAAAGPFSPMGRGNRKR